MEEYTEKEYNKMIKRGVVIDMSGNKIQDKTKQKTFTPEEFAKKYQALCEETGYNLVGNPVFVKRDDGTYSITLQFSVGRIKKEVV